MGDQVTYRGVNRPDTVKQHGQTNGSSTLLADLPPEQYLSQVVVWSTDKVHGLYFKSSDGTFSAVAGTPFGTARELLKPIFGFYGGAKDDALVYLGFYILVDFGAARGKTSRVGGKNVTGAIDSWEDPSSYNGTQLLLRFQHC